MQSYEQFIDALNDFIHTRIPQYKNVELKCIKSSLSDLDNSDYIIIFMYILWEDGTQSRMPISGYTEKDILTNFLIGKYNDVPKDKYI